MKNLTCLLITVSLFNLGLLKSGYAGPVERVPFQQGEITELNDQQVESYEEMQTVEGGLGLINGLLNLGITIGLAYLAYELANGKD